MDRFKYELSKNFYKGIVGSVFLICLSTLYYFLTAYNGWTSTVWEFMYYMNNNYYNIVFSYSTIVIFLFMYVYNNKEKLNYKIIRYKDVGKWIDDELKFICMSVGTIVIVLVLIQILIGSSVFKIENSWTGVLNFSEILKLNLVDSTPTVINLYNIILLYLYLVVVGIITFVSCIKINNKFIIFLTSNGLGLISILAYYTGEEVLMKLSVFKNVVMQELTSIQLNVEIEVLKNVCYFIVIIFLIMILIKKVIFRVDDIYFKKENDNI